MIKVMGLEELRPQPPNYNPQGLTRNAAANSSLDVQPPELWEGRRASDISASQSVMFCYRSLTPHSHGSHGYYSASEASN